ncbi:hypothetical protein [Knoellia koreensis]|uniref:DUF732 domain-containing protein n=1 Tax=Knoellia koreensis TaxID=2730921 RepID=A0A849HF19_9MICO|nr:hypothetical protein [Knoellia sp. DB2414S]NNM45214.1 hypothetical protein [Knoellia sp. DB2414S]
MIDFHGEPLTRLRFHAVALLGAIGLLLGGCSPDESTSQPADAKSTAGTSTTPSTPVTTVSRSPADAAFLSEANAALDNTMSSEYLLGRRKLICDRLTSDHTATGWQAVFDAEHSQANEPVVTIAFLQAAVKSGCPKLAATMPKAMEPAPIGMTKSEAAYVQAADTGGGLTSDEILAGGRETCATLTNYAGEQLVRYLIEENFPDEDAIRFLCPMYRSALAQSKLGFGDGNYQVGNRGSNLLTIKPGTYRSPPGTRNCYWERSTPEGVTIDNDFVTNAPAGVLVKIRPGDGAFTSSECGSWLRVK